MFVRGEVISNPDESIRLFALCEAMKFSVLPNRGGLYDQDPRLLDRWEYIFAEKSREEKKQQKEQERQMGRKSVKGGRRR